VTDVVALQDRLALGGNVATGLAVVLGVIAVVGLAAIVAAAYVIVRYKPPLRGTAAIIGGLLYLLSPVDVLPEAVLGPVGLVDDLAVLVAAITYVRRLLADREAGAVLPPVPSLPRGGGSGRGPARRRRSIR
jgi:hypothetical protein